MQKIIEAHYNNHYIEYKLCSVSYGNASLNAKQKENAKF